MRRNLHTLVFGREPLQLIPCVSHATQIIESFDDDPPSQQVFLLTGIRGSGKTALMTEITKQLVKRDVTLLGCP